MKKPTRTQIVIILVALIVIVAIAEVVIQLQTRRLVLATATGPWDSGLLSYLLPTFENKYGVKVDVVHVGTGQAIQDAQNGGADLVLVNSKELELAFNNTGYGFHRIGTMYNNFFIVGPHNDPAGIKLLTNATEAFRRIKTAGDEGNATFVSRADKSGTNTLELKIWSLLGIVPRNTTYSWYLEKTAGMGDALETCNREQAYTLTDSGTWYSFLDQLPNLEVLTKNDPFLLNPYSMMLVNPAKYPNRNYLDALKLVKFFISENGQNLIRDFKKYGYTLFTPIARDVATAIVLGYPTQQAELEWYLAQPT
jgi:tungstate transport system substrate-binding protein